MKKYALITGATSGIGYELAKLFIADGYNLVLVARNAQLLEQTANDLRGISSNQEIQLLSADLFKPGAAEEIYNSTQQLGIEIDVLVNNAGQGEWGKFTNTDLQREIDLVQLNAIATLTLTKLYLKNMVAKNEGRILQLASSVSKAPSPYLAVYAATKAFVLSLTEALIEELSDTNVTLTALQPGPTDTDFFHKARAENSVTYKEGTFYTPEEVAKAGYEGLFDGKATIVPGIQNKLQGMLNTMIPDSLVSGSMEKQMKPSTEENGKMESEHAASLRERRSINGANGAMHGDYPMQ